MARPTTPKELLSTDLDTSLVPARWPTSLALTEWRVLQGDIPSRRELADILEANIDKKLPKWFLEIVYEDLAGKRKRGRKPKSEWTERILQLARHDYGKLLRLLRRRQKSQRLRGRSWRGPPPGERAAGMVLRHYQKMGVFRNITIRRFQNLLSSRK